MLFTNSNTKLGPGVRVFSIPAKVTCPGKTAACTSVCYATRCRYCSATVRNHLARMYALAKRPDFDHLAVAEIQAQNIRLVRVHSAGDLFSPAYARAWLRVFKRCPDTTFWLYTRSWRVPQFRPILAHMAALPNVHVWFSADRDTGPPRNPPRRVRVAWLVTAPDEVPGAADLVFRTKKVKEAAAARRVRTARGSWAPVCPTETGTPDAAAVTCAGCRKCFTDPGAASAPKRVALTVV